ncbi:MAG: quinone-interacting membrane-bound oxidoreductase complex subunit QmoC [Deltaproteobacteria bacterium]|nr:quinone-interacting membrane-bound oxidoreductase complex subunit QmoC [Deltaproteobacteria bacterium]
MTDRAVINADLKFVQGILNSGGADLKKCYQCSTCTVACPLSEEGVPFPRKEMIYAQWGIRDKLINSVDSWLCHHCNDCSDQCPRGARPGDVMGAIRQMSIRAFSKPSLVAKAANSPLGALLLLLIPMLIIGGVICFLNADQGFDFLTRERIIYANMIPVIAIDLIFMSAAFFAVITMILGLRGFIGGLKKGNPIINGGETLGQAVTGTIRDILSHRKFKECGVNQSRGTAHLLMMYGFIGLFITTNLVLVIHYLHEFGFDIQDTPFPFFHPVKILGNVSALAAFIGIFLITARRLFNQGVGKSSSFDWIFIGVMFLTVLTGIMSQVFRVAEFVEIAFITYYFHLVFVFFLLAFAPHTKFGHLFYRTTAMIYARYCGRSLPLKQD